MKAFNYMPSGPQDAARINWIKQLHGDLSARRGLHTDRHHWLVCNTHTHTRKKKKNLKRPDCKNWSRWEQFPDISDERYMTYQEAPRLQPPSFSGWTAPQGLWRNTEHTRRGVQKWPNTPRRLFIVLISHIGFDKAALHFYILILETYQSKLFTAVRGETVVKTERLSGNPPQHGPECNKQPSESIQQVATPQINKGRGFFFCFLGLTSYVTISSTVPRCLCLVGKKTS